MAKQTCLADIDVVILAGGLGTRLAAALPDRPKVLAPVGERVFLDVLLDRLAGFGARRVILALGHRADQVERHLATHACSIPEIVSVVEPAPLGTAGALRSVQQRLTTDTSLVMNGDTLVDVDLCAFVAAHRAGAAAATLLCTRVRDAGRYGTVEIDARGRIVAFREKVAGQRGGEGAGAINAGIYLMEPAMRAAIAAAAGPSLERDVFQALPAGTLAAHVGDFAFLDIGVPEDLARAAAFVGRC